ncbi:nucleic acid-binding, OB-fold protein [Artemisia annua]|uniref:Nucleic acid-binding, OB-fold protein n=1 Tax=Artemisia annua TaxID=35608 RepID=A0A2U1LW57_ARTAN|nr:nucleic acid-binding, OB-fold protein [Artemisia annua]
MVAGGLGCHGRVSTPNVSCDVAHGLALNPSSPGSDSMALSPLPGPVSHTNFSRVHLKRKLCETISMCQGPNPKRLKTVDSACRETGGELLSILLNKLLQPILYRIFCNLFFILSFIGEHGFLVTVGDITQPSVVDAVQQWLLTVVRICLMCEGLFSFAENICAYLVNAFVCSCQLLVMCIFDAYIGSSTCYGRGPLILDFTNGGIRRAIEPEVPETPDVSPFSHGGLTSFTNDHVPSASVYNRGKSLMEGLRRGTREVQCISPGFMLSPSCDRVSLKRKTENADGICTGTGPKRSRPQDTTTNLTCGNSLFILLHWPLVVVLLNRFSNSWLPAFCVADDTFAYGTSTSVAHNVIRNVQHTGVAQPTIQVTDTCSRPVQQPTYDGNFVLDFQTGTVRRHLGFQCSSVTSVAQHTPQVSWPPMADHVAHVGCSSDFQIPVQGSLAATITTPVSYTSVPSSSHTMPLNTEDVHPAPAAYDDEAIPDVGGLPTGTHTSRARSTGYENIPSSSRSIPHVHPSTRVVVLCIYLIVLFPTFQARQESTKLLNLAIVYVPIAMPVSVQLFRTARDKLRGTNVPEFKVKLFSVVGSAQHELPTADCIGAIVFEDGPESESEFDIVIETHSDTEEDKRVTMNAYYAYQIHDRQMAEKGKQAVTLTGTSATANPVEQTLQRSAEKGKAPAVEYEELDLMDIKPTDMDKPIEVRVYRRWTSKNIPDPNPTGLCYILLARRGSAIQANVQLWDIRQFETKLQVGGCYRIERFGCKRTDNWQRTLNNPMALLFGRYTQVTPIEDRGFPNHYFNFAAYNEVGQRADTRDYTLTDYIGIIRDIGQIRKFGDPTTNRVLRRNIDIQNLNGNVVTFTIWNEMATDFPLQIFSELEQPVIIAISSCWARRFAGGLQLSATPATHYYLNPNVEEAEHIRQIYMEMMLPVPPLQVPVASTHQMEQPGPRRLSQLNELMQAGPESLVQRFSTQAVILNIDQQMGWYINRCRTCGNKITENMPHRHCQQPGMRPTPNYSYCFRITLIDDTGSVLVTCFSPEADSLLPSSVTELLSYVPDPDPYVIPEIIQDLENTAHVFHVHLAKGSRRGFPRFILDGAEDVPLPPLPEIPPQAEEPASYGTSQSPTQAPVETMVTTDSPSERPMQAPTVTELPTSSLTPPPQTDEPMEKVRTFAEIQSATIRRQLFQPSDSNLDSQDTEPPQQGTPESPTDQPLVVTELPTSSPTESPPQTPIVTELPTTTLTPPAQTTDPTENITTVTEIQSTTVRAGQFKESSNNLSIQTMEGTEQTTPDSPTHAAKKTKRN